MKREVKEMAKLFQIEVTGDEKDDKLEDKVALALKTAFGENAEIKFQEGKEPEEEEKDKAMLSAEVKRLQEELEEEKEKFQEAEDETKKKEDEVKKAAEEAEAAGEKDEEKKELRQQIIALKQQVQSFQDAAEEEKKKTDEEKKEFAAYRKEARTKEIDAIITNGEKEGKILPAHRAYIRSMLESASTETVVKFKEGGKDIEVSQWDATKKYIETLPNLVTFGELAPDGGFKEFKKEIKVGDDTLPLDGADVNDAAEKYAKDNNVTYSEALLEVSRKEE